MSPVATRRFSVVTADAMRDLGALVGRTCLASDVIVLTGDLGAGKTTFTQGLAVGLGIDEAVTSPTFVIARVHPSAGAGPDLVHVDAYRLGSAVELDELDLEADLNRSVVVVEWGGGLVGGLAESPIDVSIVRSDDDADEMRIVTVSARGERWETALADGEPVA
ncbi:MAG: tRNA (adenosine(37)-N6)-threonylcarbamoyltransferase complex ATPase subunit type 1 TsaE [Actinobacteria bacterium]|nr:tRNA (adenosine(37)-N6)-threonylcarbamoyltransferase complex ATPase subunit type 1 TsaE [Actinomycetota bacterium]